MDRDANMMRRAYFAVRSGNWKGFKEEFWKKGEFSEWAYAGLQEACDKVASEEVGRLSTAQNIVRKSTYFLRIILALVSGVGSVTLCDVYLHRNCFPLERCIWWLSSGHGDGSNRKKKQCC